jgi:hypothetical protein
MLENRIEWKEGYGGISWEFKFFLFQNNTFSFNLVKTEKHIMADKFTYFSLKTGTHVAALILTFVSEHVLKFLVCLIFQR